MDSYRPRTSRPSAPHRHRPQPLARDEESLTRLALPILRSYAERMARRLGCRVEVEELFSLGLPVVTDAVRRFDPTRCSFRGYLLRRLRWAFVSEVRKRARRRLDTPIGVSPAAALGPDSQRHHGSRSPASHGPSELQLRGEAVRRVAAAGELAQIDACKEDPERTLMRNERARAVRCALGSLPERQRRLLERHYFAEERFDHLAAEIGISKAAACRLHKRAKARLAAELRRRGVEG